MQCLVQVTAQPIFTNEKERIGLQADKEGSYTQRKGCAYSVLSKVSSHDTRIRRREDAGCMCALKIAIS